MNAEVQICERVIILKCCENCNGRYKQRKLNSLFEEFHCSMSSWLAQQKASDGYLPTLDALKVDENVNWSLLSSLAEPTALVSLLLVPTLEC